MHEQATLFVKVTCTVEEGLVASRTKQDQRHRVASPVTTVHPVHAVRGGVSLLALPALALLVLVPGVGLVIRRWAQAADVLAWTPLVIAACGFGLVWMILQHTTARQRTERQRAAATLVWVTLAWMSVVIFGPDPRLTLLMFVTGIFLVAWWFMVKTEPVRGIGQDGATGDQTNRILGLAEGTRWTAKDNTDRKLTVEVAHTENTHDDVQKALPKIEALSKGVKGGWRWAPATKDGRPVAWKSILTYWRADTLAKSIRWAGPDKPGAGVWEPIEYGICEDGHPAFKLLAPTDDYVGAPAEMVMGMSGSAKTAYTLDLIGTLVTRTGAVLWGADVSKAGQWVPLVRPALDWFTDDVRELRHMLNALKEIVRLRTALIMEKTGQDRWTPECWTLHGIPMLIVFIEEAAPILGELEEELRRGVEVWRSAGVRVFVSLQRGSESNIDTDLRNLIPERTCFRVGKEVDATFALSSDTIDAGAAPWTFTQHEPGMHFTETAAEDITRWPLRRRTFEPDRDELVFTVAAWAPKMARLDDVTLRAAFDSTKGRYASRQVIGVAEWAQSKWGKAPQLSADRVRSLLAEAAPTAPVTRPADPEPEAELVMAASVRPDGMTVTRPSRPATAGTVPAWGTPPEPPVPDLPAGGDDDPDGDQPDDPDDDPEEEINVATERILDEIDEDLRREFGEPPPDEGPAPDPDDVLAAARSGIQPAGVDYTLPEPDQPAPSPRERGDNFQTMIRDLFQNEDTREYDPDRKAWFLRTTTEALVERWLTFPGERMGTRPSMYRLLARFERQGHVHDLDRGRWLISEHVLDEPIVFPTEDDEAADEEDAVEHEVRALSDDDPDEG